MHKKYNKFLIVSFIAVFIFGVYSYFYNDTLSEAAAGVSLSSSLNTTSGTSTGTSNKASEDTAFLLKLASLKNITIDTSLFEDQSFKLLIDNDIKIEPVPYGRSNPFSPIDKPIETNKPVVLLKTNPATLIVNKSAVLNGSLEGATSNNIYFEYGIEDTLGKVTPKVIPSLVGSFSASVIALNPKTKYFFRVVANINGTLTYGEIMSFNTN